MNFFRNSIVPFVFGVDSLSDGFLILFIAEALTDPITARCEALLVMLTRAAGIELDGNRDGLIAAFGVFV
jgi:hypothetical protein